MDRRGLSAVGSNTKCNFLHLLCGRGYWIVVKRVMEVSDRGGFDNFGFTKQFWVELMNMKNRTGRGCVDLAFGCCKDIAFVLKRWGATEQAPPPPKKHNEWSQGWYSRTQAFGQDTQDDGHGDDASASGSVAPAWQWQGSASGSNSWCRWGSSNYGGGRSSGDNNDWWASGQVWSDPRRRRRGPREHSVGQYDYKVGGAEVRAFGMYAYDDEENVSRLNEHHYDSDEDVGPGTASDESTARVRYNRR